MSTVSRGSAFENEVATQLTSAGALVASLRHKGGAGDLLVLWPDDRRWIVECKTTARGPYADYPPSKRKVHRETAEHFNASAWLVWRAPRRAKQWLPADGWPE